MASLPLSGLLKCAHISPFSSKSVMTTYMQVQCLSFLAEEPAVCSVNDRKQADQREEGGGRIEDFNSERHKSLLVKLGTK